MSSGSRAATDRPSVGPLADVTVVEIAGQGPAPFAAMVLADLGATVVRVDRLSDPWLAAGDVPADYVLRRGRRSIALDLRRPSGRDVALELIECADAVIEGFRPGTMERLGLGPNDCFARNGRLVYARGTGWGQEGPWAHVAGHDINYIALSGALHAIGEPGRRPVPPLSLVGDFGGGGLILALGVVAGVLDSRRSGEGQIVDAAMIDGSALLMAFQFGMSAIGRWVPERGTNLVDGGAPFYRTYPTADGGHVAVGAIERPFWDELVARLGHPVELEGDRQPERWVELGEALERIFAAEPTAHWEALFEGSDACVTVIRSIVDAPTHPQNQARDVFVDLDGVLQPAPAPRFSRWPAPRPYPAPRAGSDTRAILAELGFDPAQTARMLADGTAGEPIVDSLGAGEPLAADDRSAGLHTRAWGLSS
jgi:alpha-methylacyl-CoA racemase